MIGFVIVGVIIVGFDPLIIQEPLGMIFAIIGGLGYAFASLFSKYLEKESSSQCQCLDGNYHLSFIAILTFNLEPDAINQIITIDQTNTYYGNIFRF